MAKSCQSCGKKLSLFSNMTQCKECRAAKEAEITKKKEEISAELREIQRDIVKQKDINEKQIEFMKKLDKSSRISIYSKVYEIFESNNELDESEISTLEKIQDAFSLSNDDVSFFDRVMPYTYYNSAKKGGTLPTVKLQVEGGSPFILKKDEVIHYAYNAILKEMKSVSLGYRGKSHGVSFPIGGGIRYRVGAHKGHVKREDRLLETSNGVFIITNQRLFLYPSRGHKPLSIPLNKILSYHCFENGIEIFKDGREKGYFLSIDERAVEIFGICLENLLRQS